MLIFTLQLAALLLLAYFAGAFLGCMARRVLFPATLRPARAAMQPSPAPLPMARPAVVPPPAPTALAPAPQTSRFERALTTTGSTTVPAPVKAPAPTPAPAQPAPPSQPAPAPQAAPAVLPVPIPVAVASTETDPAVAAALAAVAAAKAQAQQAGPGILPAASGSSGPASVTAPIAAVAAALEAPAPRPPTAPPALAQPPAATAPPVQPPAPKPAPTPAPTPLPAATPAPAAAEPQDLTRIRAIDEKLQSELNDLGVDRFAQIATWSPADVARIGSALKMPGRIEQENWIEQAQILAKGGETYYSRRKLKGELPSARPTPDEGERITVRVPATTRPAEVAAPTAAQPAAAEAVKVADGVAAIVPAAQAAVTATVATATAAALAAQTVANASSAATAAASTIGIGRDNLQRIAGINGEVERLLNVQGVTRYAQIASWSPAETTRFDRLLGFEGRIARERWIEQAAVLAQGGETAYVREISQRPAEQASAAVSGLTSLPAAAATAAAASVAPAIQARSARDEELASLRSVRSEAYRGGEPAPPLVTGRGTDDLKRIRGVGVLIEKKLNALGVTRYEQVANWTASDIERFSEKLDFKGRIERENWVEQARILSAGGQTEFSQRVDRGEVDSSKTGH
jgi:predicted flap endonuclease-1-like 5' DNA nuclease